MAGLYSYSFVTDDDYIQLVRAFPPSSLLPFVAQAGVWATEERRAGKSPIHAWQEWALADIARVSIVHSNEFRAGAASIDKLRRIHSAFTLHGNRRLPEDPLEALLLRLIGQQFGLQADGYLAPARSAAILLDTYTSKKLEVLGQADWEQNMLGCSLAEYVTAIQIASACALTGAGRVLLDRVSSTDAERLLDVVGATTLKDVVDRHLAIDTAAFKKAEEPRRLQAPKNLRRFTFNPLCDRPLLKGYGAGYLCPSPSLLWAKSAPPALYFTGRAHFGAANDGMAFARDLGHLFEAYVGRNLKLLPDATLHGEIQAQAGRKGEQLKSVDWIVETTELVLLVEVKATMPTEPSRLGDLERASSDWEKVGKAAKQIEAVAGYLRDGHPAYAHIQPAERPVLGLAVTLEPFYLINAYNRLPATSTPVYIVSAEELERLVSVTSTTAARLLLHHHQHEDQSFHLREVFTGHTFASNPITDRAWRHYPLRRLAMDTPAAAQ
ncbi:hypothetical protein AB0K34_37095 [Actinomadura sp. NPDC049382]|uniref:hypothetical protein n=1 Tax=Actinomadura sp. NPDC049382 TaxID=3158220 RepID=UPI003445BDA5